MDPFTIAFAAQAAAGLLQGHSALQRQKRELGEQLAMGRKFLEAGGELQREELDTLMQQEVAASTEQALYNTEQLQNILGSQRVLLAGRGQAVGRGSARAMSESSIRQYFRDENARTLNLTFKEASYKTAKSLSMINQSASIYGLQANTRQQINKASDEFKKQVLDTGGVFFNAGMSNMEAGKTFFGNERPRAPVVRSQGVDVGRRR